jgi:hypothetical protein
LRVFAKTATDYGVRCCFLLGASFPPVFKKNSTLSGWVLLNKTAVLAPTTIFNNATIEQHDDL